MISAGMKFLIVCDTYEENPYFKDRIPALKKTFELMDCSYAMMDIYEFESLKHAHELHQDVQILGNYFKTGDLKKKCDRFLTKILSHQADIIVFKAACNYFHYFDPSFFRSLKKEGKMIVGFLGDDEFDFNKHRFTPPFFDHVVAYVKSCVREYQAIRDNCKWFPNSCYIPEEFTFESLHYPEEKKVYDLVMVGNPFGNRVEMLEALASKGVQLAIYGGKKWLQHPKLAKFYKGFVSNEEFNSKVKEGRIFFAPLEDHLNGQLHMNTKIWDAAKNAVPCIATRYKPLEDDYGFTGNIDLGLYSSVNELVQVTVELVANPEKRKMMAKNLFQKTKDRFSYEKLYKNLFEDLIKQKEEMAITPEAQDRSIVKNSLTIILLGRKRHQTHGPFKTIHCAMNDLSLDFIENGIDTDFFIISRYDTLYDEGLLAITDEVGFQLKDLRYLMRSYPDIGRKTRGIHDIDTVLWNRVEVLKNRDVSMLKKPWVWEKSSPVEIPVYLCQRKPPVWKKVLDKIVSLGSK
jgi:hypothetical protein